MLIWARVLSISLTSSSSRAKRKSVSVLHSNAPVGDVWGSPTRSLCDHERSPCSSVRQSRHRDGGSYAAGQRWFPNGSRAAHLVRRAGAGQARATRERRGEADRIFSQLVTKRR